MRVLQIPVFVCLGTGIVCLVAGCAGTVANVNSLSYQDGQAVTNEEILLINIVAAAHDRAPTFVAPKSTTTTVKGQADFGATLNTVIPNDAFSPSINASRQQNVEIIDYGASKAALNLYNDVPVRLAGDLAANGWPGNLVASLLFSRLKIHEELWSSIVDIASKHCNSGKPDFRCDWINKQTCEQRDRLGEKTLYFYNAARTRCDFISFQMLYLTLNIGGASFTVRTVKDDIANKQRTIEDKVDAIFANYELRAQFEDLKNDPANKNIPIFQWSLRSPDEIIQYLGRLTALQLYSERPFVAEVPTYDGPFVLFRIHEGTEGGAAIAVRSEFGAYHVPQTNPLSSRDYSLQVMAFLIKLQNWAQQEAPIQGSTIGILQ